VQRLKSRHEGHDRLIDENLMLKTQFGLKHFAAPVTYDASDFIDRNMRRLLSELLEVVSNTENMMICRSCKSALRDEASSQVEGNNGKSLRRSAQKQPVLSQFRSELRNLMQSIEETETRYIRCVKPNESLSPGKVNLSTICRQLRCSGLVNAVDLTRETFPNKILIETVYKRFECLLDEMDQEASRQLPLHERVQFLLAKLFAERLEVYRHCEFTMPYACGRTRVFFRSGALEVLETLRFRHFSSTMIPIQACARRWLSIRKVKRAWKGLRTLQAVARTFVTHMKYKSFRHSVMKMQAKFRSEKDRDLFLSKRTAVLVLQSFWGEIKKIIRIEREQAAARILVAFSKLIRCRSFFLRTRLACERVQALTRGYFIRRRLNVVLRACLCIQRFGRHVITLQVKHRDIEASSCTHIQANIRRFLYKKKFSKMKEAANSIAYFFLYCKRRLAFVKKRRTVIKLQAYCRMRFAQKRVLSIKMHAAATKLQAFFRMKFVLERYVRIREAAIIVESFSRMAGKRITFITVYMAALKIQAFARMIALRSQYEEEFGRPIRSSESIDFSEVYTVKTSDSKETAASKISAYERVRTLRRQSLYDSSSKNANKSINTTSQQDSRVDNESLDKNALIQSLQSELADMKEQEQILREEIAAVCDMAKEHEDMVAEDYDDRIQAYEEEVISLKEAVDKYSAENETLTKQLDQQRLEHGRRIESYQKHAKDMQKSHINYIRKVSVALDEAKELRQKETLGIMAEIACVQEVKEREIRQLKSEVDRLKRVLNEKEKNNGSDSPKPDDIDKGELLFELRQLERAIKDVTKPSRILHVLERAEKKSLSKEVYVEEKVTRRAEKHVSRLTEIIKILYTTAK
jgi:myosin heavy subunit